MIYSVERGHFWFEPRQVLLEHVLISARSAPARVLDVGCGSGSWMRRVASHGYRVIGTDIWPKGPVGLAPRSYATGTAEALPWPDASCDVVTLLDTLEHVDALAALREAHRVLTPGGILLVSVPAFPALWSPRDVGAGHLRRYTKPSLASELRETGFSLKMLFGYQFFLLPLVWFSRRLARWRPGQLAAEEVPACWLNSLLRTVNEFEVWAGRLVRPPFGSSLVAVGVKQTNR